MVCKNCGANIPNGELFCPNCGTCTENAKFCKYCGAVIDLPHLTLDSVRKLIRTAVSREQSAFSGPLAEECSRWETLSLRCGSTPGNPCMFRADLIPELKFYEGKIGMGVLYIFTGGLFGIGAFVDLIVILCKPGPYYYV